MKVDDHMTAYQEHRDVIDWAVNRGILKSQRIVGVHTSRAISELFSAYLHKKNLISMGFQINHRWFKSEKVANRFPDFQDKEIIIKRLIELEKESENLIYGSQKNELEIKNVLNIFNQVENSLLKRLKEDKKNGK